MLKKIFVLISLLFVFEIKVFALTEDDIEYINPDWLEYIKLSEEEKKLYEAIPPQYAYKYINRNNQNILNNYNMNFFSLDGDDEIPAYFNLANNDGKRYSNSSKKNQSSLGLCWAFASIGSAESNVLLNGVKGIEEEIAKCTDDNPDSVYCSYKNDNEINENYINNAVNDSTLINAQFSERVVDYIRSKPTEASAYNQSGTFTLIKEGYNPYNTGWSIGSGGYFSNVASLYAYGITPIRMQNDWEKYTISHIEKSLAQVYDSVDNIYQVTEYYNYPSAPSNETDKEAWIKELKQNIMKYGAVYVSTTAPQKSSAGSCYFHDTKNNVHLMNKTGTCGYSGGHAMQIVGWDDNYTFEYCKIKKTTTKADGSTVVDHYSSYSSSENTLTQAGCEGLKTTSTSTEVKEGTWTSGKGAWILKNSWGISKTYPYLSYQSTGLGISGVREVSVKNYDNTYNNINDIVKVTSNTVTFNDKKTTEKIFKFNKANKNEYLTRFNFNTSTYNVNFEVYISNDGKTYEKLDDEYGGYVDYPGLHTFDIDNYLLSNNEFYIKTIGLNISNINAFTKNECSINNNCDNNKEISSYIVDGEYFTNETKNYNVISKTRNMSSGSKLTYSIYDENNNDVSNMFNFNSNYLINNSNFGTIEVISELPLGKYYLHTSFDDAENIIPINIVEIIDIELKTKDIVWLEDKTTNIEAILSSTVGVSNYKWQSSNSEVATIDENGKLTLLNSGLTNITLTVDTLYGEVSETLEVIVYDKIYTIEDFFKMHGTSNTGRAYYLMNDLDFNGVNFEDYLQTTDAFFGIFNGGHHTVKNITRNTTDAGLFGYVRNGTIKNLNIIDSYFSGEDNAGSVTAHGYYANISGIYTNSKVVSKYSAGGVIGESLYSNVSEIHNTGEIIAESSTSFTVSGGIIGDSYYDEVKNCRNDGRIYSNTSWKRSGSYNATAQAGGIMGSALESFVSNSYNIGEVLAETNVVKNEAYFSGITTLNDVTEYDKLSYYIKDSYYIPDSNYTEKEVTFEKTLNELKKKDTFVNWDFDNIWYIREDTITPVLRTFPVEVENVTFDIFSNVLYANTEYNFNYEVLPYTVSDKVTIYSEDENLFVVEGNKIKTKNNLGTSNIVFKVGDKEFKYPITVESLLIYDYDKTLTNKDVTVNVGINYTKEDITTSYLKLNYTIGETTKEKSFDYGSMNNQFSFVVKNNNDIILDLYVCNNTCELIKTTDFEINNIDKDNPVISIESDNISSLLTINVNDSGVAGLSEDNKYQYSISNSNILTPMAFNNYIPNETINNVLMTYNMKYLWVKNISDNAGNYAGLNDYLIFDLDIVNVDADDVILDLSNNILNKNSSYEFSYEVIPINITNEVIISSENEELFEIQENKIITKNNLGTSNIVFNIGEKEFKFPITIKEILSYEYDKNLTNQDINVKVNTNYSQENINSSYLRLDYSVGNTKQQKIFDNNVISNEFEFKVKENNNIKLELYSCNNTCEILETKEFTINNIDKEKPVVSISSDNITKRLTINIIDKGTSGLSDDNLYLYSISDSNINVPTTFKEYIPNAEMNNIEMNKNYKYLWIYNISDNVGNKVSEEEYIIYDLKIINIDAEDLKLNIFSNTLNPNTSYEFNYELIPNNVTYDVLVNSENKDLFVVEDNKIITGNITGESNIVFNVGSKEFKFPIRVKNILEYSYDDSLTNNDVYAKIAINYLERQLDINEYLKLEYKIGEEKYVNNFEKGIAINNFEIKIQSNNKIDLDLYICNENCEHIINKKFVIDNIDKEKPTINIESNNIKKTLKINVKDYGISGLNSNNKYEYAITDSNIKLPNEFKSYKPGVEMNNVEMNKNYKYLWIRNISDNIGNKASDNEYIIYTLHIEPIYYTVNYYDEFKNNILKTEKIKEDEQIIINFKPENYEDSNYIYEFDYWDGYKSDMIATNNMNFIAVYKKTPKDLSSDIYKIENNYIYNIKLDNINGNYSVDLFKSNLKNYESYSFYENNNAVVNNLEYIKTGLKYKNIFKEYKIILAGDVTGDGRVKMNDVMKIANHLVNKNVLYDEYLIAGDVTEDNNTKMNDVMKIANALVNGGSL